jgi:hypothetical protein
MRCNCFVRRWETPKGRPRMDVRSWWHTTDLGVGGETTSVKLLEEGFEICGGTIRASVEAVDEPYMGGSSAILEVSFRCGTCDWTFYPELPNQYSINEFLTKVISELEEAPYMAEARQVELDRMREREEAIKAYKAEQRQSRKKK